MKNLVLLIIGITFLFSDIVLAQELEFFKESMFYRGEVNFEIKEGYNAGEIINTNIQVINYEPFPIFDGYLVIEVVKDCPQPVYPTNQEECNIIYEEKIYIKYLEGLSEKNISWSYRLPEDLKPGIYRIDVYFKTKITPIVGIPTSFYLPTYKSFRLSGVGEFPMAKILWKKTHVGGGYAQSGPGVIAGSEVEGAVFVEATKEFSGNLLVKLCSYDDTACDSYIIEKNYPVQLRAEEKKAIIIKFPAPTKPDAYAIRLELVDKMGRLNSLYRSRIVVLGEGGKILKLAISKPYYEVGENGWVRVLVTGPLMSSPILASASEIKNVTLRVYALLDGEEIFRNSSRLDISVDELVAREFSFTLTKSVNKMNVCAELVKNGNMLDKYCYLTISKRLPPEILPQRPKEIPNYVIGILIVILIFIVGIIIFIRRR